MRQMGTSGAHYTVILEKLQFWGQDDDRSSFPGHALR